MGTTELDWRKTEAAEREYVGRKTADGRYEVEHFLKPKLSWSMIEDKEIIP